MRYGLRNDFFRTGGQNERPGDGRLVMYLLLADALVVLHFAFIVFVMAGAFLAHRWPKVAWAHIPAALWGAWIEVTGGICPLTPMEVRFRIMGGEEGYAGSFIGHYLVPIIYPSGLTRTDQLVLGGLVVAVNAAAYVFLFSRRLRAKPSPQGDQN